MEILEDLPPFEEGGPVVDLRPPPGLVTIKGVDDSFLEEEFISRSFSLRLEDRDSDLEVEEVIPPVASPTGTTAEVSLHCMIDSVLSSPSSASKVGRGLL